MQKRDALQDCIRLWRRIHERADEAKKWPSIGLMRDAVAEELGLDTCPACRYTLAKDVPLGNCDKYCPIRWPGGHCMKLESPYRKIIDNWPEIGHYALDIVQLAERALRRCR